MKSSLSWLFICSFLLLAACQQSAWNNPYPEQDSSKRIYYDSFSERPKHLDPVSSYSANEYVFLGQIYEPPLQYHFLKRPYELIPLTATELPQPIYLDGEGRVLSQDTESGKIDQVKYRISIKPGILFQPHPAFAKDASENYLYHDLTPKKLENIHALSDFKTVGTRELLAKDYVYQIKRMAHPKIHSPIAGLMGKYIVGLNELAEELHKLDLPNSNYIDLNQYELPGVKIIDDTTFEVTLKQKYPQFLYWLSMSFFAPMPWEADFFYSQAGMVEKNITLDWYPVGTGPFMLTENNPNRRMVLEQNPNFRGEAYPEKGDEGDEVLGLLEDAGKTMPFIDKAIYSLEKESIPSWNKFLQGYYDTSGIVSDSFDQAVQFNAQGDAELTDEMQEKGIRLITAITTSTYYMGFNMADDVIGGDSERAMLLRRAISIAVDYKEYISIFANGRGKPAQGPIPPGIFGALEDEAGINPYIYKWENNKAVRRDIEEARRLMVQAGYPNGREQTTGKPLVLHLDTPAAGPGAKAGFDWIRKQFSKLGINLVIRATDYNRFQEKIRKGTAQMYQWGWNADYPDPENFMFLLYGPNGKVKYQGENASNYSNAEFDKLFNQMKSMNNSPERQDIINQMVAVARKDAPWLWGFHPVGFSLHHEWYHNAKPNLMANNKLKYRRIEPGIRTDKRIEWNKPVWWPVALLFVLLVVILLPAIISYRRREKQSIL
ncbi:MAG: ABC transporter substrate-binding protein [Proteobacteria bacterium]|nr:peptide ABC transporter substrate-binding protein [Pseudomonadota bacterium]NOG61650.1 ABC transporter substrate-binding protein [Pseudomonadota bacterium]